MSWKNLPDILVSSRRRFRFSSKLEFQVPPLADPLDGLIPKLVPVFDFGHFRNAPKWRFASTSEMIKMYHWKSNHQGWLMMVWMSQNQIKSKLSHFCLFFGRFCLAISCLWVDISLYFLWRGILLPYPRGLKLETPTLVNDGTGYCPPCHPPCRSPCHPPCR